MGLIKARISKKALVEEANKSEANVKRAARAADARRALSTRVTEYQTGGALSWD